VDALDQDMAQFDKTYKPGGTAVKERPGKADSLDADMSAFDKAYNTPPVVFKTPAVKNWVRGAFEQGMGIDQVAAMRPNFARSAIEHEHNQWQVEKQGGGVTPISQLVGQQPPSGPLISHYRDKPLPVAAHPAPLPYVRPGAQAIGEALRNGDKETAAQLSVASGIPLNHPEVQQAASQFDYSAPSMTKPIGEALGAITAASGEGAKWITDKVWKASYVNGPQNPMAGPMSSPTDDMEKAQRVQDVLSGKVKTPKALLEAGKNAGQIVPFFVGGVPGAFVRGLGAVTLFLPNEQGEMGAVSLIKGEALRGGKTWKAIQQGDWGTVVENAPALLTDAYVLFKGGQEGLGAIEHPIETAATAGGPEARAAAFGHEDAPRPYTEAEAKSNHSKALSKARVQLQAAKDSGTSPQIIARLQAQHDELNTLRDFTTGEKFGTNLVARKNPPAQGAAIPEQASPEPSSAKQTPNWGEKRGDLRRKIADYATVKGLDEEAAGDELTKERHRQYQEFISKLEDGDVLLDHDGNVTVHKNGYAYKLRQVGKSLVGSRDNVRLGGAKADALKVIGKVELNPGFGLDFADNADAVRTIDAAAKANGIGLGFDVDSTPAAQGVDAQGAAIPVDGKPFEFPYVRNTKKATNEGGRFGQDVEPSGRYMLQGKPVDRPNMESGTARFEKPLVVDFGEGYQEPGNWKKVLSQKYGGKTGNALSQAIRDDGYDGIVTIGETAGEKHTLEIVDLRRQPPPPPSSAPSAPETAPVKAQGAAETQAEAGEPPAPAAEPPKVELSEGRTVEKIARKLKNAGEDWDSLSDEQKSERFLKRYESESLKEHQESMDQFFDWIRCGGGKI
jgi:hypothetical protein